jgi:YrbI family 3-deoxy-D-manno-octulosonate 8-phosphate phosphatase
LDFDGVLTDNRVIVDQDGRESVACHRGDGLGLAMLKQAGLPVVVLSTERNPVVTARCKKLGIECVQGLDDKHSTLLSLCAQLGFDASQVAYVGNDVNDLSCLRWVGMPIAVADSVPDVLAMARVITTRKGGDGAVREVTDAWLAARQQKSTARKAA